MLLYHGRKTIKQVIVKLCKDRLLSETQEGILEITSSGKDASETGEMMKLKTQRCLFHFIDGSNEFLRIKDPENKFLMDLKPYQTGMDWSFDIACLEKRIAETNEWKKQRQFPTEIQELIKPQPSDETTEDSNIENTLIVDKAQSANCAILVKFDNGQPFELAAYPLSDKGYLLTQDGLFFLKGRESIIKAFPNLVELPDKKQVTESLSMLVKEFTLDTINKKTLKIENTHIIIKPVESIDINWSRFYWQNLQQSLFCCTNSKNATYLRKVVIESQDGEFDLLNLLFEINNLPENNPKDLSTYRTWLQNNNLSDESIRKLASLAWELENYNLAYTLAELEDMTDANI